MKKQIANASRLIRSERELRAGVDGPAEAPAAPALTEAETDGPWKTASGAAPR